MYPSLLNHHYSSSFLFNQQYYNNQTITSPLLKINNYLNNNHYNTTSHHYEVNNNYYNKTYFQQTTSPLYEIEILFKSLTELYFIFKEDIDLLNKLETFSIEMEDSYNCKDNIELILTTKYDFKSKNNKDQQNHDSILSITNKKSQAFVCFVNNK
ncbi:hypothetical protein ABK040_001485 [Willaertia magna]